MPSHRKSPVSGSHRWRPPALSPHHSIYCPSPLQLSFTKHAHAHHRRISLPSLPSSISALPLCGTHRPLASLTKHVTKALQRFTCDFLATTLLAAKQRQVLRRSFSRLLVSFLIDFLFADDSGRASDNLQPRMALLCWPTVAIDEAHLLLGRRSACARTLLPPTATSLSQLAATPRDRPTPTFHARQWAAIADCCSESVVFDC